MKRRKISIVLFYDKDGNILLQDRKDFTTRRFEEEYGFFGGKMEAEETPEEALKREIREELNIDIKDFEFFKKYTQEFEDWGTTIERNVFLAPMPDLKNLKVDEGKPFITNFKEGFMLKMMPGDAQILQEIFTKLKEVTE